jgi:capsular polysaccharide biosynthesis protein
MVEDVQAFPLPLTLLRRWWWLTLLSVVLSLAASYEITNQIKPTYEARAQIDVDAATVSTSAIGTYTDRNSTLMLASAVADMANSYRIAGRAVEMFHLAMTPSTLLDEMTATAASDAPIVTIQVDDGQNNRAADLANAAAAAIIAVHKADQGVRFHDLEKTIRNQIAATTHGINTRIAKMRALTASSAPRLRVSAQISSLSQQVGVLQTALGSLNAQLTSMLLSQAQSAPTLTMCGQMTIYAQRPIVHERDCPHEEADNIAAFRTV